ncbi:OB-fold nucleic acid binding domain-containing protein [Halococcus hamelinensis]|uniref:Putative nuclease/nucleic acid binding OB-fold tRNA/helicase-type n=1 Tax=Halococcus hamelinensis 100A6 TaxID=1132509 RepID=M0M5V7_9EURY|nr:OB-fold nucleic acid binding domain-containing protein [Halococcus hamelinensis]EMA39765.1 putative nuclease/nucleic acid binding OB-fold tRNA/helicase-type [Halococcus hamelinensis 100A6]
MGSCIICGTSTEGYICESHQEDVVFDFEGSHANQLTPGRFYRGSVDGFAEFGVFIDIGDSVTGLLHRSELDSRLESLDWDSGDEVYVQVTDVHDNGNVDLTWSIRQSDREFRGALVDTPEGDELPAEADDPNEDAAAGRPVADTADESTDAESTADQTESTAAETEPTTDRTRTDGDSPVETASTTDPGSVVSDADDTTSDPDGQAADAGGAQLVEPEPESESTSGTEYETVRTDDLDEYVDDSVRIEGEVASVRQTGGPTVFTLRDEAGTVECAAFEEAGVRAYPGIEAGAFVAVEGHVERHRGGLQVESDDLSVLDESGREAVETRMADALADEAEVESVDLLAEDSVVADLTNEIRDLAGTIRRAVLESRPVVVRHDASADGYLAAAAIERATLPFVEAEHARSDAGYHYFDRRPLAEGVYDMDSATRDVTKMLDARERHDEAIPLFVFCGVGGTSASSDGLSLLSVYDAERAVLDVDVEEHVDVDAFVGTDGDDTTAAALAANVAVHIDPEAREDLAHLPAVSFWEHTPAAYADLADEAGYDAERAREVREAVALVANYQSYEDKRELVRDLVFEGGEALAAAFASRFRTKRDAAIETARAHLDYREVDGGTIGVLDTDAFTHRYDFPPTALLCDELHRRTREAASVLVGVGEDELFVRGDVDIHAIAEETAERVPDADVSVGAARDDRLEFLLGERDAVQEAVLDVVAEQA